MPSTHLSLHYHIVFSTRNRERLIHAAWREDLHRYLGGCANQIAVTPQRIGGVDDHIHLLLGMKATHCLADVVRDLKRASSRWIHEETSSRRFGWQEGYGAFTVSRSNVESVSRYIDAQPEHHRRRSFQDEYLELLRKHDVPIDERYLW